MHDEGSHPLLAQLPLTVSPFLSLPTATTLPYSYKPLSSTLPRSILDPPAPPGGINSSTDPSTGSISGQPQAKPQYVTSESTGHAAHPDDIIASCQALQAHLSKMQKESQDLVNRWQNSIKERDLAEKRRVAPGWLDVEEGGRLLVPEKVGQTDKTSQAEGGGGAVGEVVMAVERLELDGNAVMEDKAGEELDRAFGGLR